MKSEKIKDDYKNYNQHLRKTKSTTKLQKKKQCELNERRILIRKQSESNRENKTKWKKTNGRNNDRRCWFKLICWISNNQYNIWERINLHEIKSKIL